MTRSQREEGPWSGLSEQTRLAAISYVGLSPGRFPMSGSKARRHAWQKANRSMNPARVVLGSIQGRQLIRKTAGSGKAKSGRLVRPLCPGRATPLRICRIAELFIGSKQTSARTLSFDRAKLIFFAFEQTLLLHRLQISIS